MNDPQPEGHMASYIGRRKFLATLGGAAAWPLAARAQQPMPVIGFLSASSPEASAGRLRALRQGLKASGYVEGDNVTIIYRWAEGEFDQLAALATELLNRRVAVIVAAANAAVIAANAATKTTPIVFLATEDPVKLGLVVSLSRPSGNATGINVITGEVTAKRLEHRREVGRAATRVAGIGERANPRSAESTLGDVSAAARTMGLQVQVLNAGTSREINAGFETFVRTRPDLLFVGIDAYLNSRRAQLVNLASRH